MKDVAPSAARVMVRARPGALGEFRRRYGRARRQRGVGSCATSRHDLVTLVYAAHDEEHNQAVVLRDHLRSMR